MKEYNNGFEIAAVGGACDRIGDVVVESEDEIFANPYDKASNRHTSDTCAPATIPMSNDHTSDTDVPATVLMIFGLR